MSFFLCLGIVERYGEKRVDQKEGETLPRGGEQWKSLGCCGGEGESGRWVGGSCGMGKGEGRREVKDSEGGTLSQKEVLGAVCSEQES